MRDSSRLWLCLASVLVCSAGCDDQVRGKPVSPAQLQGDATGNARTAQSGYLHDWRGNAETVPRGLQRSLVVDEIKFASWQDSTLCFDVVMRTDAALNQPLSAWTWKMKDRGGEQEGQVEEVGQPVTQTFADVDFRDSMVKVDAFAPGLNGALNITKDSKGTFLVNERRGRVCGSVQRNPKYDRMIVLETGIKDPQGRNLYNRYFWTFLGQH